MRGRGDGGEGTSRGNLAAAMGAQGESTEGERVHRARFATEERMRGPEHPDVVGSCCDLAVAVWDQGQGEAALGFARRAEEGYTTALGTEHPDYRNAKGLRERIEAEVGKR